MMRFYGIFLICIFAIGCRTVLTQQTLMEEYTYVRIDAPVTVTNTHNGSVYAIPERQSVRKIRLLGEGAVENIEIWARADGRDWRPLQVIHRRSASPLLLPIEIFMHHLPLTFKTDAIRIVERTRTPARDQTEQIPKGQIDTVEFYTTVPKDP